MIPHPRGVLLRGGCMAFRMEVCISVCIYIALADWLLSPKSGGAKACF